MSHVTLGGGSEPPTVGPATKITFKVLLSHHINLMIKYNRFIDQVYERRVLRSHTKVETTVALAHFFVSAESPSGGRILKGTTNEKRSLVP